MEVVAIVASFLQDLNACMESILTIKGVITKTVGSSSNQVHTFLSQPAYGKPPHQYEWLINGRINGSLVEALADTGANVNAIFEDEASTRGLKPEPGTAGRRIKLPSGKNCTTLGTTTVGFQFQGEDVVHSLSCGIVERLEYKFILGFDFLRKTETLSRFKHRIKEVLLSGVRKFSLRLLDAFDVPDEAKARMYGRIDGKPAVIVPDTGSSIMAISASYARRRRLQIDRSQKTVVRFAQGSTAQTTGTVIATWKFQSSSTNTDTEHEQQMGDSWEYEWHVIEGLSVDGIVNIDFHQIPQRLWKL